MAASALAHSNWTTHSTESMAVVAAAAHSPSVFFHHLWHTLFCLKWNFQYLNPNHRSSQASERGASMSGRSIWSYDSDGNWNENTAVGSIAIFSLEHTMCIITRMRCINCSVLKR